MAKPEPALSLAAEAFNHAGEHRRMSPKKINSGSAAVLRNKK
jgi:hypothetical protein